MMTRAKVSLVMLLLSCVAAAQDPEELAQAGARAMQEKDYPAAEKAYREFLRLSPDVAVAYSNLGVACYSQDKFPCAEEAFTHALKLAPDLFAPNFVLGEMRFHHGRYQEALTVLKKAVAIQPDSKEARKLYCATLVGLKQYERAIGVYIKSLETDPNDVDSYYGLGSVYLEIGQNVIQRLAVEPGYGPLMTAQHYESSEEWQSLALNAYTGAIARLPAVPGIRVSYAKLEIARKNWDAARKALEAELRLEPQSYEARFQSARVALAQGAAEKALHNLDEAVRIRPEFFQPLPNLALEWTSTMRTTAETACAKVQDSFAVDYLRFVVAGAEGHSNEAKEWAAKAEAARDKLLAALQSRPVSGSSEAAAVELLAQKRYERGLKILLPLAHATELREQTKLEVARALYRTRRPEDMIHFFAGSKVPRTPEVNYLLGLSYKEVALEKLNRMVQLAPESARSHQILGDAYFAEKRFEDAVGEYQTAVKLEAGNQELHYLLGNAYFMQTQFSLALESFDRVISLDPLNAEAHMMRGEALVQLGERQEALAPLNRSLELNPELPRAHVLLGKLYGEQGKLDQALRHLEKGAVADKDGGVHYQLFVIYRRLNQPEKAAVALRVSQELRKAATPPIIENPQDSWPGPKDVGGSRTASPQ